MHLSLSSVGASLCGAGVLFCLNAQAGDVLAYQALKGQVFFQAPGLDPLTQGSEPFVFVAQVRAAAPGRVLAAQIGSPDASAYVMVVDSARALWTASFAASADLDLAYPAGAYSLTISSLGEGTKTSHLNLGSLAYPSTPRFHMTAEGLTVNPVAGLILGWDAFAGASSGDGIQVVVENHLSQELWRSPDLGQPGALAATATSISIPTVVWTPDPTLPDAPFTVKLTFLKVDARDTTTFAGAVGCTGFFKTTSALVLPKTAPPLNDLARYGAFQGQRYSQTGTNLPVLLTTNMWVMEAGAVARGPQKLTGAKISPPGGVAHSLTAAPDGTNFAFVDSRSTAATFQTAYPGGAYTFGFDCANDGPQAATLSLAGDQPPTPPRLLNLDRAQYIDPSSPFSLAWDRFVTTGVEDLIQLTILDSSGQVVLSTPDWRGGLSPLSDSDLDFEIPQNTLASNQTYQVRLRFQKTTVLDNTQYPNALGYAGYFSETWCQIGTFPEPPPALLIVSPSDLPPVGIGQELHWQFQSLHGRPPYIWSLAGGALPPGLAIDPESGELSGWAAANGGFQARARLADSTGQTAEQQFSLSVTGTPSALVIVTTNLPPAIGEIFYTTELSASGGVPPYDWSLGGGTSSLPPGLVLTNGMIVGPPAQSGVFPLDLRVTDAVGQKQQATLTLSVPPFTPTPVLAITNFARLSNGHTHLRLSGEPGELYTVETSSNLVSWAPLFSTNTLTEGMDFEHVSTAGSVFYRARQGLPAPPPNPLDVRVILENTNDAAALLEEDLTTASSSRVGALLTPYGGELTLIASNGLTYTLSIPSNALTAPESIQMSLVRAIDGLPLSGGLLGAVQLAPEGLVLLRPATLTIQFPQGVPDNFASFAFDGPGEDFYLTPVIKTTNSLKFQVVHFSGAGAGAASPTDIAAQALRRPCKVENSALQDAFTANPGQLPPRGLLVTILTTWYKSAVLPFAKAARTRDEVLRPAVREYVQWARLYLLILGEDAQFHVYENEVRRHLACGYLNAINKAEERGVNQYKPFEASRMLVLLREATLWGFEKELPGAFDSKDLFERVRRLFRFKLVFDSTISSHTKEGHTTASVRAQDDAILELNPDILKFEWPQFKLEIQEFSLVPARLPTRMQPDRKGMIQGFGFNTHDEHKLPDTPCSPHRSNFGNENPHVHFAFTVDMPKDATQLLDPSRGWLGFDAWRLPFYKFHETEIDRKATALLGTTADVIVVPREKWRVLGRQHYANLEYTARLKLDDGEMVENTQIEIYHQPKTSNKRAAPPKP